MECIDNKFQEEIDNFREKNLPCGKNKVCLPLYNIIERIKPSEFKRKEGVSIFQNGVSFFKSLNEEGKKELFEDFWRIIYEDMKPFLYPGEDKIKPECENYNCPVYSVMAVMTNGEEISEYISLQNAAIGVFKHKESERVKYDVGWGGAYDIWTKRKVNFNSREIPLAQVFRECYDMEKEKNGHFCIEKFSNLLRSYISKD